jgi:hypothetical protein
MPDGRPSQRCRAASFHISACKRTARKGVRSLSTLGICCTAPRPRSKATIRVQKLRRRLARAKCVCLDRPDNPDVRYVPFSRPKKRVQPLRTRTSAKAREILRENVGPRFLSLRHYAESRCNARGFAPIRVALRSPSPRWMTLRRKTLCMGSVTSERWCPQSCLSLQVGRLRLTGRVSLFLP